MLYCSLRVRGDSVMVYGPFLITALIAFVFGFFVGGWFLKCGGSKILALPCGKYCRRVCPRDGTPMHKAGEIKQGPRKGKRDVYICPKCGHKTM